jgi:hypothetical protein
LLELDCDVAGQVQVVAWDISKEPGSISLEEPAVAREVRVLEEVRA